MFKKMIALMMALALLALPTLSLAEDATQTEPKESTLTVQGSATVTLMADWAQVNLGVNSLAETVDAAAAANAQTLAAVVDALTAAGISSGDLVTDSYTVNAQYDYQYGKIGQAQVITGYQVSNTLRVSVRQVDQLGAVLDAAMKAGANECYGITFQSSQSESAIDQALTLAIAEGARKADLMAKAAGKTIGRLVSLTEDPVSYQGVTFSASADTASAPTTILADGLTFSATVTMVYEMK